MTNHEILPPQNPGSLTDFEKDHPEFPAEQVFSEWNVASSNFRQALPDFYGVSTQDVHEMNFDRGLANLVAYKPANQTSVTS